MLQGRIVATLMFVLATLAGPMAAFGQAGPPPAPGTTYHSPNGSPATTWSSEVSHDRPPIGVDRQRQVYRGDGRAPDVIFNDGFAPWGTNPSLPDHVRSATHNGVGSVYVSTSKEFEIAEGFARNNQGYIYEVQTSRGYDVNRVLGPESLYPEEHEIAVPGRVNPENIRGAWVLDESGQAAEFIPNPNYRQSLPSWNTDPVVAASPGGQLYDARTGRPLSDEAARDAMERADAYGAPRSVTLYETGHTAATGIDLGLLEDGRVTIAEGRFGEINADVLRAEYESRLRAGVTRDGVAANLHLEGQATLIGLNAETREFGIGDLEGLTNASVQGNAQAFVGADSEVDANLVVSRDGVTANASAEAFLGARAEAEGTGQITICGVNVNAQASGQVSFGIGGEIGGYFTVDWSTMTVKLGGRAAAAFGPGAGAGTEVEVSLAELMRDPRAAANCAWDGIRRAGEAVYETGETLVVGARDLASDGLQVLSDGADAVTGALSNAASDGADLVASGARKLCFWCDDPPPPVSVSGPGSGYNGGRNDATVPEQPAGESTSGDQGGESHGGGIPR